MNTPDAVADAAITDPATSTTRCQNEQHPARRQSQRELDREYCADRVRGVGHPEAKVDGLHAHVEARAMIGLSGCIAADKAR